jgi:hypothetical protein
MPTPPDPIKGQRTPPPPPEIIGGEERYEVKEIIDSRMRGRRLQYLVQWKGYGHKENSWISEGDLDANHGLPWGPPNCTETHKHANVWTYEFPTMTMHTTMVGSCTLGCCALRGG